MQPSDQTIWWYLSSLDFVPRTLAQNAGQDSSVVLAALTASHVNGSNNTGIDISGENEIIEVQDNCIDLYLTKKTALKLALDAALTVLKVDQIIMSKPSGGPKK